MKRDKNGDKKGHWPKRAREWSDRGKGNAASWRQLHNTGASDVLTNPVTGKQVRVETKGRQGYSTSALYHHARHVSPPRNSWNVGSLVKLAK